MWSMGVRWPAGSSAKRVPLAGSLVMTPARIWVVSASDKWRVSALPLGRLSSSKACADEPTADARESPRVETLGHGGCDELRPRPDGARLARRVRAACLY